jgi:hypothetical protein
MPVRRMRLMIGLFFLAMAALLFARSWLFPDLNARFNATRMTIGACLALVLAGVNLAKWYAGWAWSQERATPVRRPLQRDPSAREPDGEPNPEFDFGKQNEDRRD